MDEKILPANKDNCSSSFKEKRLLLMALCCKLLTAGEQRIITPVPGKVGIHCFVNSGNSMNKNFQISDKYISNQSGSYKNNEHSQNGYVIQVNVMEKKYLESRYWRHIKSIQN